MQTLFFGEGMVFDTAGFGSEGKRGRANFFGWLLWGALQGLQAFILEFQEFAAPGLGHCVCLRGCKRRSVAGSQVDRLPPQPLQESSSPQRTLEALRIKALPYLLASLTSAAGSGRSNLVPMPSSECGGCSATPSKSLRTA